MLDHRKLLAGDPPTTTACRLIIDACLRRYLKDESRIREVAQSTFAEAMQKLRDGATPSRERMVSWLLNCASNALRRELTQIRRQVDNFESRMHSPTTSDSIELLEAKAELARIEQLLELCSKHDRLVFFAKVRGDSAEEIAAKLGTTPAAVRSSVSRTRQRLRLTTTPEQQRRRLMHLVQRATQEHPSRFGTTQESSR
jgi:RNA polymerase sigma factor (sigma-70 family)